jgi:hypothetical protein
MREKFFKTEDFILAATIITSLGTPLLSIEKRSRDRVTFVFHREDVVDDFVEAYRHGHVRVDPLVFTLAQNSVRRRLGDARDESMPTGLMMS